ncbi:MAG: 4-(cytidine 5'-diphospho)-2-C-methyl-D-erythritol kinase [Candidatus Limnocylindrales bacterium]
MSEPPVDPSRRLTPVVRLAPAKLNLSLAIVGRGADGYHRLHSVMVPLALADRLSLAPAADRVDTLHVDGFDAGPNAANLVLRALAAAREAIGAGWSGSAGPPPALAARLDKRIPVAAGLAGGSSDAAAALDGALEAWGAGLTVHERLRVAARLGSDVPFFLAGGPALVEGRGESVTPLRGVTGPPPGVLLVTPGVPIATADVFAAHDVAGVAGSATRTSSNHLAEELRAGLTAAALVDRAGVLAVANDLIPATQSIVPGLVGLRRSLNRRLGRPVGQSGSGPSLWVLYPSLGEAEAAAADVGAAFAAGALIAPGDGPPFVAATEILARRDQDRSDP